MRSVPPASHEIQTMHRCHAHKCTTTTRPSLFMCPPHWRRLPLHLKRAILAAYRPGQEKDKRPFPAYIKAAHAAQLWLAERDYPNDVDGLRRLYERVEHFLDGQAEAAHTPTGATLAAPPDSEIEIVRIGEDPFGREERTVFYRNHAIDPARLFYCWASIWPASWPALPATFDSAEI